MLHALFRKGRETTGSIMANTTPTFSTPGTGKLVLPVGPAFDESFSVIVQQDGRILLAGESRNGDAWDFSLLRLDADGNLDTSFNGTGTLVLPVGGGVDRGYSVTQQSDGKILMVGESFDGSVNYASVVRLNLDGSLDESFNGTGKLLLVMGFEGNSLDRGFSILVQDDKIVVAGQSYNGSNYDFGISRLNLDGSLDTTFNGTGKLLVPMGVNTSDIARSVSLQADGKLVLVGYRDFSDFAVARVNIDGTLDTTFNGTGTLVVPIGSGTDVAFDGAVQPLDGKIVMAGYSYNGTKYDFAVVRLNTDGSLDTSFNGTGKLVIDLEASRDDYGSSVVIHPDGRIIVAGQSALLGSPAYGIARINADGTLDTTFNGTGKLILPVTGDDTANSVSLQDGKILVAGISSGDFSVVRLNEDGSLDTTFGATPSLGGSVSYTENAAPVALDTSVTVYDAEFAAIGAGGNYDGAVATLSRSGGASAQDLFSAFGNVAFIGGDVILSGLAVGTAAQGGGVLTIEFNSEATQARVNEVLSSLAYANGSDAPPSTVDIEWRFSDGENETTGATRVDITAVNDAPTGVVTITGTPFEGQTLTAGNTLADADGLGAIGYQWQANGTNIAGATGSSLLLGHAQAGATISVVASYADAGGTFESVASGATVPVGGIFLGTSANNSLTGAAGNDLLDGGAGRDRMAGVAGDDTYIVDNTGDVVVEGANAGTDLVLSSVSFTLAANVEKLTLTGSGSVNATGNTLANVLLGNDAINLLTGGLGADTLTGGGGADKFVYKAPNESTAAVGTWDVVTDFTASQGDRIDLSAIDVNTFFGGRQGFVFIGTAAFSNTNASRQLRFDPVNHMLFGSTDPDKAPEFAIELVGVTTLTSANLIL
jgi:uncharacterized delta-60 repeat protein